MKAARLIILSLMLSVAAPVWAEPPADIGESVEALRKKVGAAGVSIAIVEAGKTTLSRGWGVRKIGERAPVDEQTLFQTGSTGKAMTAAALAILVDEGKIAWDDPVIKHMPWFRMYDAWVTREITIRAAFEQGSEDHHLKQDMEARHRHLAKQEVRWQRLSPDRGIKSHHCDEEQDRRQHRQRPRNQPRNDRFALVFEVTQYGQDHHRTDDIIAGIGQSARHPIARRRRRICEALSDQAAKAGQREDEEQAVDGVEQERDIFEHLLDRTRAPSGNRDDRNREQHRSQGLGPAEGRGADRPRRGAEHREDQDDEDDVGDLERDPGGAEKSLEKASIIISAKLERQREGQCGDDAPDQCREQHRGEPAPRTRGHEIFGKLAPRCVAAANDDGLQRKPGQQEALEPARPAARLAHTPARHASTSASNDAPPRIGSATGRPRRPRSAAISASAASGA